MGESIDQLRVSFVEETRDLINELEDILLSLENNAVDSETVDQIFRSIHTIKGSGGMLGFDKVLEVTHDLEDIYDKVRSGDFPFSAQLKDISLETIDILKLLLASDEKLSSQDQMRFAALCRKIKLFDNEGSSKTDGEKAVATEKSGKTTSKVETFLVQVQPTDKGSAELSHPKYLVKELSLLGNSISFQVDGKKVQVDAFDEASAKAKWAVVVATAEGVEAINEIFSWAKEGIDLKVDLLTDGDLLSIEEAKKELLALKDKLTAFQFDDFDTIVKKYAPQLVEEKASEADVKNEAATDGAQNGGSTVISSIRVATDKVDQLMNLVSEMVTLQARLNLIATQSGDAELIAVAEKYGTFSKQLRDNAFTISLVPFGVTITRYKRMVHDLSEQLQKKVEFVTEGEDTVLDKKIIETLSDPIMHILRNSIDHGIESPDDRKANNKLALGRITMRIYHQSNSVIIKIIDDGKGIDLDVIRTVAIQRNIIGPEQKLTDNELMNLIFLPGFSSAKSVSNVSGRGVGLDVVKKNISEIRGTVDIQSVKGQGSTFTIKLPLTLSIIDGLQVKIENRDFIIPLMQVDKIISITKIQQETKLSQVMVIDGAQVPYFDLRGDFGIDGVVPERRELVLVNHENEKVALIVDSVVGENQTVLKPLGKHYKRQDFFSGGTILGDGSVALVLDVSKIVTEFSKK
jgi:two-component system chemotaxis sensor kinase CheA